MNDIEIRGLERHYRSHGRAIAALAGVDLRLRAGELTAIVGRSGCGKTTLLRHLAGLESADAGTIDFGAGPRPRIGLVFQEPRLLPWKSVHDNLALAVRHLPPPAAAQAIADTLALVGLADCAAAMPNELSGGMAQRVGLARALCRSPQLLLLDEPFGALDALTRSQLHLEFARIRASHGITTVLVTHDIAEATQLADRVIHLKAGRVAHRFAIDLPHPRRPGDAHLAASAADILDAVLERSRAPLSA
ncbi:MAG: ABC transporter ATP-binding protein [Burkholderiaceae bacterium]